MLKQKKHSVSHMLYNIYRLIVGKDKDRDRQTVRDRKKERLIQKKKLFKNE